MDPTARFEDLVQGPESEVDLGVGAMLISAHATPGLDVDLEVARLEELAVGCPDRSLPEMLHHLFAELGFSGNREHYYDPRNSYLNEVIRRRLGIPITLSLVVMEVGRRLGHRLTGIGMPGHFLVRHDEPGQPPQYVDAFAGGQLMDADACVRRFQEIHGPGVPFEPTYLDPVHPTAVLARILGNLKAIHRAAGRHADVAWVTRLRVAIPGTPLQERRELADALSEAGDFPGSARVLEELATMLPDGEARATLVESRSVRARLN